MSSFHNRARAAQLIDFEGLRWGLCTATDIDISLDWQGRTFIFTELKGQGKMLTKGQQYHLEGVVKAIRKGGLTAYAILAHHATRASEDIIAAKCIVHSVYDGNSWEPIEENKTLAKVIDGLYDLHLVEYPPKRKTA